MGKEKREAKRLIEQIREADKAITESEKAIAKLESAKAELLAGMLTESPGQRTITLQDLLTKDQLQAVVDILNRPNLDDIAQTRLLKDYLRQFDQQLQAKGVLPDYLAYLLLANAAQIRQMSAMWN